MVFESNTGIKDTVLIHAGYPNGYISSFDYWSSEKMYDIKRPEKRMYIKLVKGYPNFEANQKRQLSVNLQIDLIYSKDIDDSGIVLKTNIFKEKYYLNDYLGTDTLVFEQLVSELNVNNIPYINQSVKKNKIYEG